jgi:hypothetical protein
MARVGLATGKIKFLGKAWWSDLEGKAAAGGVAIK